MKPKLIVPILLVGLVSATEDPAPPLPLHNGFSVLSQAQSEPILQFSLPQLEFQTVEWDGKAYTRVKLGNAGTSVRSGEPHLPGLSTLMAVEPGRTYRARVTVTASETYNNVEVPPLPSWDEDIDHPSGYSQPDPEAYNRPTFPVEPVRVSAPLVMRDLHLVRVTLTPFRYHPGTRQLEVITQAVVHLEATGTTASPVIPPARSRAFEPLYRSLVVNYDLYMRDIPYQRPSILYILPTNTSAIQATIDLLIRWRHQTGFEVHSASTGTIGTTNTAIKAYIQTAYNTWANPPEYVVFVGDADGTYGIPTFFETYSYYNGEGDHPYAQLAGNDVLPELFLGRLSFNTTTELATIVNKTLQYESNPYVSENWLNRACVVGDPSPSGISVLNTKEYTRMVMENSGLSDVRTVYNDPFPSQMSANLNDGVAFFNYRGYYGVSGFNSGHINALTNGFKLPVTTVITCGTGSFASASSSMIETFIRAGTPSQPRGAVASIGTATLGTHTMFNNAVDMGFYAGVFTEGIETAGAALMRGKLELFLSYPTNPNNYVDIYSHWNNLMGDPALRMWTMMPRRFSVVAPASLSKGTNYLEVNVSRLVGGTPVEGALVTILKGADEVFESGFTHASGTVILPVTALTSGEIKLTITSYNYIPYQATIQVTDPAVNVNLAQSPVIISDDTTGQSNGNGDGLLNPGETVELGLRLHNYGSTDVPGVLAVLQTLGSQVTILEDSLLFGDLSAGTTATAAENFLIQLNQGLHDGTDLGFRVVISDDSSQAWNGILNLSVSGTALVPGNPMLLDGDGILNPGQTLDMQIPVGNSGVTVAPAVTGTLASMSPGVEIIDETGTWGNIGMNQTLVNTADVFTVAAHDDVIPGSRINLTLLLNTGDGYHKSVIIPLQVGVATLSDPLGPDAHGYYIYDTGDQAYTNAPYFNWVEIDNRLGGQGTATGLYDAGNNQDDVMTMALPFNFRMYGRVYGEISICSNGWLSLGSTSMSTFRNYRIPGSGGPSPMIAAFWDDLEVSGTGKVFTWYDTEMHRFIVEWSQVRTYQNNSLETFQVILKDPQYYYTPTGDGEILIQYLEFNNTSISGGSATTHGNYCTVGIEDHTGTVGLQYTFGNLYPPTARTLADSSVILITTKGSSIRLKGDVNEDTFLDLFDVLSLIDYILSGNTGSLNPFLADLNEDGIVNILDMIGIVQIIMEY